MTDLTSVYLISALAFVAVLVFVEGLWLLWKALSIPTTVRIARRMHQLAESGVPVAESISILRGPNLSNIPALRSLLVHVPRVHLIARLLDQSGMTITVARLFAIQAALVAGLWIILALIGFPGWLAVVVAVAFGILLPLMVVMRKRDTRRRRFSEQLPDTLEFIARSLRAGNPLTATFKSVAENMPEPSASEFGFTFNELNYGIQLEDALEHLGQRTGSEDMRYFITAVLIQQATGGNLAEILGRLAAIMRQRSNTYREIVILATEMRYSANILVALPFVIAGAISIFSPGYLTVLFTTDLGLMLVGAQLLLMGIGYWIVQRMINFRV